MPIPLLIPLAAAGGKFLFEVIKDNKQAGESDEQTAQRLEAERIERERLEAERIEAERIKQRNKKYFIAGGILLVLILLFIFTKGNR